MSSDNGNIFGEGFPIEIVTQIENRQKVYGSGLNDTRTEEEIRYLNSNNAFIRLISSTDIKNASIVNSNAVKTANLQGNVLAAHFVLFSGTSLYGNGTFNRLDGISFDNKIESQTAYGMGGDDFGIKPMPGIISANINHENRGSLRRAEVKIKAYNKAQFEIIDILYLRLGFHILLEWGHSIYLDSGGNLQRMDNVESLGNTFLAGNSTYIGILKEIADRRKKYAGNFDAMLGRVTNFHWSVLPDGSYDITVNISSVGDLIESLKANVQLESPGTFTGIKNEKDANAQNLDELTSSEILDRFASKHTIGAYLYFLKFYLADLSKGILPDATLIPDFIEDLALVSLTAPLNSAVKVYDINPSDYSKYRSRTLDIRKIDPSTTARLSSLIGTINSIIPGLSTGIKTAFSIATLGIGTLLFFISDSLWNKLPPLLNFDPKAIKKNINKGYADGLSLDWDNWDTEYYIRLGTFLEFLEKIITLQAYTSKNKKSSLLIFDTEDGQNLMFAPKQMISVDPRICVINRTLVDVYNVEEGQNLTLENAPGGDKFIVKTAPQTGNDYGDLMNIYLNMGFILRKMDEIKDDQGRITMIEFLQNILKGVNTAFSGVCDLDVFIDETTNKVKIIDKNPLPDLDYIKKELGLSDEKAIFSLYGYSQIGGVNQAGFIRDFSFTTELTPAFSTMITVGAAANSAVVGENDTALSKLNVGLEDRYKQAIENGQYDPAAAGHAAADLSRTISGLEQKLKVIEEEYNIFLTELSPSFTSGTDELQELNADNVDAYKDTLKTIYEMREQISAGKLKLRGMTTFQKEHQPKGTGFIPFNLNLTMDGLSGMKINQQFYIDTAFLPSNYPESVRFLIKNLSHTIEGNRWTTKIESYCVATRDDTAPIIAPAVVKRNGRIISSGGGGVGGVGGGGGGSNITTPTYSVTPSVTSLNKGDTVTFTIDTTGVPDGTTLYYTINGVGMASSDFTDGAINGQYIINTNKGTVDKTAV